MDMEEIKSLWEHHFELEFPRGYILEGDEENPIADLALLDGDVAGCIMSFIWKQGHLDAEGLRVLEWRREGLLELRNSISEKNPHFTARIDHLLLLSEKVLEACRRTGDTDSK